MKTLLTTIATAIIAADKNNTDETAKPKETQQTLSGQKFSFKVSQFTMTLTILSGLLISTLLIYTGTADTVLTNLSNR